MRITYDPAADAACIELVPLRPGISKSTIPIDVEGHTFVFDFDEQNRLVFIEILGAKAVLPADALSGASRPGRQG